MLRDKYDLVIIGGGPVGVTAALRASALGRTSILIDATPPRQFQFTGPTGLFSKALRDSALRLDVSVLRSMGIGDVAIWAQVRDLVEQIMRKSGDNNARALALARVPHLRGTGKVLGLPADGAARVRVGVSFSGAVERGTELLAQNCLLATGSVAVRMDGLAGLYSQPVGGHVRVYDSDSIKGLGFLPRSVVIVGGGIIAVEFARIFAALAADVTMVVRAADLPKSLARVGIDRGLGHVLQADLQAAGVTLLFETEVAGAAPTAAGGAPRRGESTQRLEVQLVETGSSTPRPPLLTDLVLTATGRRAVTSGLGLDDIGVHVATNGDVAVGADLQTAACGVYAAGDMVGAPQLASTGIAQAEAAVEAMCGARDCSSGGDASMSPQALLSSSARYPIGIWTIPECAPAPTQTPRRGCTRLTPRRPSLPPRQAAPADCRPPSPLPTRRSPRTDAFVGLTAEAAEEAGLDVVEGVGRYSDSIRGHVHTVGTSAEGEYLPAPLAAAHPPAAHEEEGDGSGASEAGRAGGASELPPLRGPALKLVVERAAPNAVVGVHVFGDNACELVHFGTTLVQGRKTLSDVLAMCYAAVTYHELYKLAARDALATLQADQWRTLYHELDAEGDAEGVLSRDEVVARLAARGTSDEAVADIVKALFVHGTGAASVTREQFVKRAMRLQNALQLELVGDGGLQVR